MSRDQPYDDLTSSRTLLDRLIRDHSAVAAHMNHGVPTRGSGHTDPVGTVELTAVEAAALRRIASQAGRYQALIERALVAFLEADVIRALAVTSQVDTAKAALDARCDGWDNPACVDNGVQNVWINGHCHWLCQRCWDKQRKRHERAGVDA